MMFHLEDNFWIYRKGFKIFSAIKFFNRFLKILNICFTAIPYFTEIFWWEWYTDVCLAIDVIVMTFVKNESKERSTHDIELFMTCAGLSMICVAISWPVELVMLPFHQFVQPALKSQVTAEQRGNSSFIWLRMISNFVQKISNSSWLWLSKQRLKNIFHFVIEFL